MIKLKHMWTALKIRYFWAKGDKKRDAGLKTPSDVVRFDDICYSLKNPRTKWHLLDVYRPRAEGPSVSSQTSAQADQNSLKKLPVIISVHGGAWIYGDKNLYQYYCMSLARRGFAVVNFSYRLIPENKFPSAIEDTEEVFQWVAAHAAEYGFDLNNVFAVGDSAGAHLLSIYSAAISNPEYGKNYPFIKPCALKLRAVALNCGVYKLDTIDQINSDQKTLVNAMMPRGGTPEELALIDATAHVSKDFPKAYVMTCKGDFLLTQAPLMTAALEKAGVKYEYHVYGTDQNPLWHVFHCDQKLPDATVCNDAECAFFRCHMG